MFGLPWWLRWERIRLQCGRPGFNPWVEKIPWRRERTHSSILAWRTPWTEEPGGLPSVGSQRVRHDRVTEHSAFHCVCAMDTPHLLCPLTPQWALRLSLYIDSWLHVPFLQKGVDMSTGWLPCRLNSAIFLLRKQ